MVGILVGGLVGVCCRGDIAASQNREYLGDEAPGRGCSGGYTRLGIMKYFCLELTCIAPSDPDSYSRLENRDLDQTYRSAQFGSHISNSDMRERI